MVRGMWSHEPEFGRGRAGEDPPDRRGAYAVLWDAAGERIALVRTPEGWFLPGGGCEVGESLEETLRREVMEECGLQIADVQPLGRALEHARLAGENRWVRKVGDYFSARAGERRGEGIEADHALEWRTPAEAIERLTHESQVWVVRRVAGLENAEDE